MKLPEKKFIASFDIDAQNTFTPICPNELPVVEGDLIADELNAQAKFASLRVASRDAHTPEALWLSDENNPPLSPIEGHPDLDIRWPAHAIIGTKGFDFIPGLDPAVYDFQVFKGIEVDKHPNEYEESELEELFGDVKTNQYGVIKPQLAKQSEKVTNTKIFNNEWMVSRKLDGVKALFYYKNGEIFTASRGGEDYNVATTHIRTYKPLVDFFKKHPLIQPKTFLGDSAFDAVNLYKELLSGNTFGTDSSGNCLHFSKAYIPLNSRSHLENKDYTINADGIPCCPHDPQLPMKPEGNTSHLRCGLPTFKFVCPKMKWEYDKNTKKCHRVCHCKNPCTSSKCGRMVYIYSEKDLRAYPGVIRGTQEWDNTYKVRSVIEQTINHLKDNLGVAGRRTQNEKTLHADLLLAGITQLVTVLLADKIHHHEYVRSLKPLIA